MDIFKMFRKSEPVIEAEPLPTIKIIATVDVGYGNILAIHGNWPGSGPWRNPLPMECRGADHWEATIASDHPVEFKLIRNGRDWEIGDNHRSEMGGDCWISPQFPQLPPPQIKQATKHRLATSQGSEIQDDGWFDDAIVAAVAVAFLD